MFSKKQLKMYDDCNLRSNVRYADYPEMESAVRSKMVEARLSHDDYVVLNDIGQWHSWMSGTSLTNYTASFGVFAGDTDDLAMYEKMRHLPRFLNKGGLRVSNPPYLALKTLNKMSCFIDAVRTFGDDVVVGDDGLHIRRIAPDEDRIARYGGKFGCCVSNTKRVVAAEGGEQVFGYSLYEDEFHWELERHCVWRSPTQELYDCTENPTVVGSISFIETTTTDAVVDMLRCIRIWKPAVKKAKKPKEKKGKKNRKKK